MVVKKLIKILLLIFIISNSFILNTVNANNSGKDNVNNNVLNIKGETQQAPEFDPIFFKPKHNDDDMSLIVTMLDGSIYALQYSNGKLKWNLNAGKSLYSTSQDTPKFSLNDESSDEDIDITDEYTYYIRKQEKLRKLEQDDTSLFIPNIDGSGEVYKYQSGNIKKLPFTIHDIISSQHLIFNDENEDDETSNEEQDPKKSKETLYIGSKSTSVIIINSKTGEILKSLSDEGIWQNGCPNDIPKDTLLFTRSDYKVLALDPISGNEKWNLSVGEFTPLFSEKSQSVAPDSLIFEGSIEVLPTNSNKGYKLFVQKKKSSSSFWEIILPSPPMTVYAHSTSKNILKKLNFNRRLSTTVTSLLPYNQGSTDLMIPSTIEPTFIFDSFDGNFFITSNERSEKDKNQLNIDNNRLISDGTNNNNNSNTINQLSNNTNTNSNSNNSIINSNKNNNNNDSQFINNLLNDYQIKILLLTLIIILLSKRIKNWIDQLKLNNNNNKININNNNNNFINNIKKTPKKKNKNKSKKNNNNNKETDESETDEIIKVKIKEEEEEEIEENLKEEKEIEEIKDEISKDIIPIFNNKFSKKIQLENGNIKVGKLEITTKIMGTGSCGTVVYKGYLDGRKVAIKKMLSQFVKFADREVSILLHSDEHMNVVRYYAKEEDEEFIYLALSFCKLTLDHLVVNNLKNKELPPQNILSPKTPNNKLKTNNNKINNSHQSSPIKLKDTIKVENNPIIITNTNKQMILELLLGLSHLHSLNIVHRDIKPNNILIDPNNRIKISDMGLGKLLDVDDASLTFNSEGHGWQPAEYLNGTNKNTKKVDIFSLGCVIFYLVTGLNPFGIRYNREKNVLKGKFDIEPISSIPDLYNLVHSMIRFDPDQRPTIQECLDHPFFWNTHKRIQFLAASSDYLEFEKPTSPLNLEIDSHIDEITECKDGDWLLKIDKILVDNIGRYRKYNGKSIRDLLRVIRNKFNHYRDLSQEEKTCLGAFPDGFLNYYESKFPKLLITTYLFIVKNLKSDASFKQFFNDDQINNQINNQIITISIK